MLLPLPALHKQESAHLLRACPAVKIFSQTTLGFFTQTEIQMTRMQVVGL